MKMAEKVKKELQELSTAIVQMINTFNELREPIKETSKNVPEAHEKLNKVTDTTEKATHEMLDIVDQLIDKISRNQEIVTELKNKFGEDELLNELSNNFDENMNNSYSMMESLQFQDITSQQIGHISVILEDIQEKMNEFLTLLGETGLNLQRQSKAFNPEAQYDKTPEKQGNIDEIISSMTQSKKEEG